MAEEIKKKRPSPRPRKVATKKKESPKEEPSKVEPPKEEVKPTPPGDEGIEVRKIGQEEAVKLREAKKLIGWNSITGMAKIKR